MRDKGPEMLTKNVVNELTRLRKAQALSHDKIAEATGLSRAAISYIESHKRSPTLLTCAKISRALGVRLADIVDQFEK